MNKIDCRKMYEDKLRNLKADISQLPFTPQFIIYKGDADTNFGSQKYIELKLETAKECGIEAFVLNKIAHWFDIDDTCVDEDIKKGEMYPFCPFILQLPCSDIDDIMGAEDNSSLDADRLKIEHIINTMQLDSLREKAHRVVRLYAFDTPDRRIANAYEFFPATPKAVLHILKQELGDLTGKRVAVVGCRSKTTGRFLSNLLTHSNMSVSLYHSKSRIEDGEFERCDAVVSCVGKAGLIKQRHFGSNRNCVCVDVGVSRGEDGKVKGDFDRNIRDYQRWTPYVNGVGLLTRIFLMENILKLYMENSAIYLYNNNQLKSIMYTINPPSYSGIFDDDDDDY